MGTKPLKIIITILLITFLFPARILFAEDRNTTFNILIINSYNIENDWERLVFQGLKENLSNYNNIEYKIEFLDSKALSTPEYNKTFIDLLNIKYSNTQIDAILTIDDEAFNLVRENIFNESSIFYKTPTVFIGVNNTIKLSEKEKNFITGVIEMESNLRLLNIMIQLKENLKTVYLLMDDSVFSDVVKNNILSVSKFYSAPLNIEIVKEKYIDDITPKLLQIDPKTSSILLVGDFKYKNINQQLSLEDTIKLIKEYTDTPIYSKTQPYIYAGAIGGIVDWGQYHGFVAGEIIAKFMEGTSVEDLDTVHNSLDLTVFNYDALYYYNINPLLLPKDSFVINKGPLDLLLPKPIKTLVWVLFSFGFVCLLLLIVFHIKNKRKQELTQLLYEKALENEKFKNDFLTTMSHEFRTPINIILSTSHLLNMKLSTDFIDPKYFLGKLEYITQNSNRLLKLVNNIIDITKLESGFMDPIFELNNIVEIIENTVLSVVDFAHASNLNLIFDTENEEIITSFDKNKIERCILNLLSNSIKFTPSGGSIYVSMKEENNNVIIQVKDTGNGIPKEQLQHIFERFYQVDYSLTRSSEGSGLGLYIVKGLIELHNGHINVESEYGKHSIFTIVLPINKDSVNIASNNLGANDLSELVKLELSDIITKE